MRGAIVALMIAGCGRIGFDATGDGGSRDGTPADACNLGPWTTPRNLVEVNSTFNDSDPALSADGLELIFGTMRAGASDLYEATRADPSAAFGPPTPLPNVNSTALDADATLSHDGLTLYFESDRDGLTQVYVATRTSRAAPFGTPAPLASLAGMALGGPSISADGSELFITRVAGNRSLAVATGFTGSSVVITDLAQLNVSTYDGFPTISGDGLTLYWEGLDVSAAADIFTASRPTIGTPFGAGTIVNELSDPVAVDGDPEISFDGRTLLFTSDRSGAGGDDLFISTRACQ